MEVKFISKVDADDLRLEPVNKIPVWPPVRLSARPVFYHVWMICRETSKHLTV